MMINFTKWSRNCNTLIGQMINLIIFFKKNIKKNPEKKIFFYIHYDNWTVTDAQITSISHRQQTIGDNSLPDGLETKPL